MPAAVRKKKAKSCAKHIVPARPAKAFIGREGITGRGGGCSIYMKTGVTWGFASKISCGQAVEKEENGIKTPVMFPAASQTITEVSSSRHC